jgi:non-heme chloroperoxidase
MGPGAYARLPGPARQFLNAATARNAEDVQASFAETISIEQLAAFDRPTLIVHGDASPTLSGTIATSLAALLPRAGVASVPGATHGMLDSHPRALAQIMVEFCDHHPHATVGDDARSLLV